MTGVLAPARLLDGDELEPVLLGDRLEQLLEAPRQVRYGHPYHLLVRRTKEASVSPLLARRHVSRAVAILPQAEQAAKAQMQLHTFRSLTPFADTTRRH